jgi:hypothetical protein
VPTATQEAREKIIKLLATKPEGMLAIDLAIAVGSTAAWNETIPLMLENDEIRADFQTEKGRKVAVFFLIKPGVPA